MWLDHCAGVLSCVILCAGCSGAGGGSPDDAGLLDDADGTDAGSPDAGPLDGADATDGADIADGANDMDAGPSNRALVFPVNPVSTPEPVEVDLPGVADDADGSLLSSLDDDGLRRLRVLSCRDEGATNVINVGNGPQEQRICTLRPMADKNANGNFVHTDWQHAVDGVFDVDDVHAEVSLYHHASSIYDLVCDERVGLFSRLPQRHEVDGQLVPLTLVANYRLPGNLGLSPFPVAMYLRHESLAVGMGAIMGLEGIEGDVLLFGQGPQADFAYDGETVYHEFGHLLNQATAGLDYRICIDGQGMHNLTNALEQGLAETFVFLASGQTRLFEYLEQVTATGGFAREVDQDLRFPDDMRGVDQFDGLIVAGANHEVFGRLQQQAGFAREEFLRLVLGTLLALEAGDGCHDLAGYAEGFLLRLADEGHGAQVEPVRSIFASRGMFEQVRAKDISGYSAEDHHSLYIGSSLSAPWNTTLRLQLDGQVQHAATAMVQLRLAPADTGPVIIQALVVPVPDTMGMFPAADDWDLHLALRAAQSVRYEEQDDGSWTIDCDALLAAECETLDTPQGPIVQARWTLEDLEAGTPVYLHPINLGTSPAFLLDLEVVN